MLRIEGILSALRSTRCLHLLLAALAAIAAMAGLATAQPTFTPVRPGVALQFPRDFGAHHGYKTEWWYATGWLTTAEGKSIGYQVTFFRAATGQGAGNPSKFAARDLILAHAALSDASEGKLLHDQRSAREGFGLAYAMPGDTKLKLDHWRMQRDPDGSYQIDIPARGFTLKLTLAPTQALLLQGEQGFSRKGPRPDQASYYYSEPQLRTTGAIVGANGREQAVTGVSWLDHEWSTQVLDPEAAGWDWAGINLDDGGALMAFQIRSRQGSKIWSHATWRDASGKITHYAQDQVSFTPQARWRSPRTNAEYPVATTIATGDVQWQLTPLQQDQELDARLSSGAVYWEGAVTVRRNGQPVGRGYLELTGYYRPMKL